MVQAVRPAVVVRLVGVPRGPGGVRTAVMMPVTRCQTGRGHGQRAGESRRDSETGDLLEGHAGYIGPALDRSRAQVAGLATCTSRPSAAALDPDHHEPGRQHSDPHR